MVRLKALQTAIFRQYVQIFQFQYGAIKRIKRLGVNKDLTRFQFQYGAIKSNSAKTSAGVLGYFNSSMVRLKVNPI